MSNIQSSYRQIIKATSLFGGVQVVKILVAIVRSKVIAVLLGPTGMGIAGLLNSTILLIGGFTNFGLGTSAVKDIATANSDDSLNKLSITVTVLQRLIWGTGIFGAFIMLIFSQLLSNIAFGNDDYTVAFIILSITILFNQLTAGKLVILQGLRKLHDIAKASILGSVLGLVISLPLYYWFGVNGIVPAIILTSVSLFIITSYFRNKIKIEAINVNVKQTLSEGKSMIVMGFAIAINGVLLLGSTYIMRIYISTNGSLNDVGLYSAGFAIINYYIGMVFTAMLTDYYPRLSAIAHDNKQSHELINQQANIALLILAPIIILFLVFIKVFIVLLLSNEFLAASSMVNWAMLGVFFKAASWPIGFYFVPRGDSKTFIISEVAANIYMLILNILGYSFFGLEGLGIAFLIGFILYFIQVYIITSIKYHFRYVNDYYKVFVLQFLLAILTFAIVQYFESPYTYILGFLFFCFSFWISLRNLDKFIDIKAIIKDFTGKFLNNSQ